EAHCANLRSGGRGTSKDEFAQHPIGAELPKMTNAEFELLKESLRDNGFDPSEPIVLLPDDADGGIRKVLDGWHRHRASTATGVSAVYVDYNPQLGDPAKWVERKHKRRNLAPVAKAGWGAKIARR